ncbi:putative ftsJ-like methyltransferase [Lyophyllum shimeji]|uniref:rRNA methyltransferase 2, mitochondrial n=1 Tax=Lyophyllum shimeji TaxID=47721 RepID=A0A9P3PU94_LYOSH|nr:putative ftsJ-like methyltransferase [Lyophyllum shimeji]
MLFIAVEIQFDYMLFRPTSIALGKSKPSSAAWLARQFRDPYVKQRLSDPADYRARSAFKLLEIDNEWDNFLLKPDVNVVVDLGAAPGGWSQVVAGKLGWGNQPRKQAVTSFVDGESSRELRDERGTWRTPRKTSITRGPDSESLVFDPLNIDDALEAEQNQRGRGTIIAVDLLPMQPIPGVHCIQANFLSPDAETLIHGLLSTKGNPEGKVDVILSDMAANASGNLTRDVESSLEICLAVFDFARRHMRSAESIGRKRGGVLLMKHFMHPLLQQFRKETLESHFNDVKFIKPRSSRTESREGYFLCQGWNAD